MNVQDEYEGKHRIDGPLTRECFELRKRIRSAMRGVPNQSPRHALPHFPQLLTDVLLDGEWS